MNILRLAVVFAALVLLSPPALAVTRADTELMCRAVLANPGTSVAIRILKGDCALALKDFETAIGHYRAALRADPANVRVRADLSSLLMLTGKKQEAMPVLRAAESSAPGNPDAQILTAIGTQLSEGSFVAPRPQGGARGLVSISRFYDSNINAGSGASTFDAIIAGTLLTLNVAADARGRPGWGTTLAGQASYMHVLDADHAVMLSGDLSGTIYEQDGSYNRLEAAAGLGFVHQGQGLAWSLTPNLRLVWRDSTLSSAGLYVDGRVQRALDENLALVGFGKLGYTITPADSAYNALNSMAGFGLEYRLSETVLAGLHVLVERSNAAMATEAYTKLGGRVFMQAALNDGLSLDGSYGYFHSAHDQTAPVFPLERRDSVHEIAAGLTQDLSGWRDGLSLSARYSYQNVDSSIDFHDRDRHVLTTSLQYRF